MPLQELTPQTRRSTRRVSIRTNTTTGLYEPFLEEVSTEEATRTIGIERLTKLGLSRALSPLDRESINTINAYFLLPPYAYLDNIRSNSDIRNIPLENLIDIQDSLDAISPINIDLRYNLLAMVGVDVPSLHRGSNKVENGNVKLMETSEIVNVINTIFVPALGYFRNDDKRIIKDYIKSEQSLILDDRYTKYYVKIYTDISETGELICKNTYTASRNVSKYLPSVEDLQNGNKAYISEELISNSTFKELYIESINDGIFALKSKLPEKYVNNFTIKHPRKVYRKVKGMFGDFERSIKNIPNTYQNTLGKRYPFGIEIETISGYLPLYLDQKLYYSAVHDGSLRDKDTGDVYGGEYVSDVLWGDLGLQQLKKLCFELTKRCLIDKRCGVHCHLSDVTFSQENIVLMYYIYQTIEDEIFDMMPRSRRNNEYCRRLKRVDIDLNNLLPNNTERNFYIKKYYDDIIVILSQKTHPDEYVNKKKDHPKGFKCGYDHSAARYCWVNFIPAVFNTRKNGVYTIEFRPNPATTSYRKIKNWLKS